MSFLKGFEKTAAEPIVFSNIAKKVGKGLIESGSATIKDTLKLRGLKHVHEAVKNSGGVGKSLTTQAGRERLAHGMGKAAPAAAVGGAYTAALYKTYKKVNEPDEAQNYY